LPVYDGMDPLTADSIYIPFLQCRTCELQHRALIFHSSSLQNCLAIAFLLATDTYVDDDYEYHPEQPWDNGKLAPALMT
jgi:hypothetical protein